MKTRISVLVLAVVIMAACGGNSGNNAEKKACCKESAGKTCCKAAEVKKIISAKFFVKPDKVNDFLTATKGLIEKSRAEEGNISYSLYQDPQDPTAFLFFEEWKNQEAFESHLATEHFIKFNEMQEKFKSKDGIVTIYDSIDQKTL
jgi:quinol monooxygenase YgiN